ncbi:MAG: glycosyltransferase family 4 protein, partial [Lentisphaeraceae bacterium]|nr:glycosyltransferase family 4 protein [Lentisphaeraceae bacterium]
MRIVMLNKYLYARAGAETYMIELSRALIKAGHEVAFFGMDHPKNTKLGPTCTVSPINFDVRNSLLKQVSQVGKALMSGLLTTQKLKRFCREFKADLIHAHNVYNQISPVILKNIELPVIMTAHDYKPICPSYNLYKNGKNCYECLGGDFRPCIKGNCVQGSRLKSTIAAISSYYHRQVGTYNTTINYYVAPSHFMKKQLCAGGLPAMKIKVIHNFSEPVSELIPPGKNLLYVGRICKEKGVDCLIKAFKKLPTENKLVICGVGPMKEELEAYTRREKLNVKWLGFISPLEVKRQMQQAAMVFVPSLCNEICSMTIVESLACGRPVIASNSGGNPELIRHGQNGYIYPAGDALALSTVITQALNN